MAEYGNGVSFGQACTYDKERIKMAFQGKLMIGESVNGFEYEKADKDECKRYILGAYDEAVYQARTAMASGRALERMLFDILPERSAVDFMKYMQYYEEERRKADAESPYKYEESAEEY